MAWQRIPVPLFSLELYVFQLNVSALVLRGLVRFDERDGRKEQK